MWTLCVTPERQRRVFSVQNALQEHPEENPERSHSEPNSITGHAQHPKSSPGHPHAENTICWPAAKPLPNSDLTTTHRTAAQNPNPPPRCQAPAFPSTCVVRARLHPQPLAHTTARTANFPSRTGEKRPPNPHTPKSTPRAQISVLLPTYHTIPHIT